MGVTDLGGADGMVFRWDEPTAGNFWMRDTPMPLSIAFFAADGSFVSAADMEPCLHRRPTPSAPATPPPAPYQYAVEVAAGGLGRPCSMGARQPPRGSPTTARSLRSTSACPRAAWRSH